MKMSKKALSRIIKEEMRIVLKEWSGSEELLYTVPDKLLAEWEQFMSQRRHGDYSDMGDQYKPKSQWGEINPDQVKFDLTYWYQDARALLFLTWYLQLNSDKRSAANKADLKTSRRSYRLIGKNDNFENMFSTYAMQKIENAIEGILTVSGMPLQEFANATMNDTGKRNVQAHIKTLTRGISRGLRGLWNTKRDVETALSEITHVIMGAEYAPE